jgi:hypothetical protein
LRYTDQRDTELVELLGIPQEAIPREAAAV